MLLKIGPNPKGNYYSNHPFSGRVRLISLKLPEFLQVAQAAQWLQRAEAILICAGNLFTLENDAGGPFRQPPLTRTEGLEYGIPTPGSWNPIRALWHEQPGQKVVQNICCVMCDGMHTNMVRV